MSQRSMSLSQSGRRHQMSSTTGKWLVPFKGRNHSGATQQNFLWCFENAYIMDNHRAALWCWLQDVPATERIKLLHIDEHTDTLYSRIDEWLNVLPPLNNLSVEEYLSLNYPTQHGVVSIVRWDNYLSLYLERYREQVEQAIFATHGVGDKPRLKRAIFVEPQHLPGSIDCRLTDEGARWIVNVDLDYFFCDQEGRRRHMFSDEYVTSVFTSIRRCRDLGRVACLTICLTPDEEFTGGWAQAEELCAKACGILGLPFELPLFPPYAKC